MSRPRYLTLLIHILWLPQRKRPLLALVALIGVASGTALLYSMSIANFRARTALEGTQTLYSQTARDHNLPVIRWQLPGRRFAPESMTACLERLPFGIRCRGAAEITAEDGVSVIGLDDGLSTAASPIFSTRLVERLGPAQPWRGLKPQTTINLTTETVLLDFPSMASQFLDQPGYDWIETYAIEGYFSNKDSWQNFLSDFAEELPPDAVRIDPAAEVANKQLLTESYLINLQILALTALLVAALLIWNIAELQTQGRRRSIALLHSLGMTKGQILSLLFADQMVTGLVGAALGVAGGAWLENLISEQVVQTIDMLYGGATSLSVDVSWLWSLAALSTGCLLYIASSLTSTKSLLSVAPARQYRRQQLNQIYARHYQTSVIVILLALVILAPFVPPFGLTVFGLKLAPQPFYAYLTAFLIFLLMFQLASSAAVLMQRFLARLLGSESRWPSLQIALRRLKIAGLRNKAAIGTMACGFTLVVGISLMVDGFRSSLTGWIDEIFAAEFAMTSSQVKGLARKPQITRREVQMIRRLAGVKGVDCTATLEVPGQPSQLIADLSLTEGYLPPVDLINPRSIDTRKYLSKIKSGQESTIIVSEPYARRNDLWVGDTIQIETADSADQRFFTIGAIARSYSQQGGDIVVMREQYQQAPLEACDGLRVYHGSADKKRFRKQLRDTFGKEASFFLVSTRSEIRRSVVETFEQTFAVTNVMTILAWLLGSLAVLVQLTQSVGDRRQEWLSLRRIGMTWSQLLKVAILDSFFVVLIGKTLGALGGLGLGWVLVRVINVQSFGWSFDLGSRTSIYRLAGFWIVGTVALTVVAAAIAACLIRPNEAWRLKQE